jgi:hypothetical protein
MFIYHYVLVLQEAFISVGLVSFELILPNFELMFPNFVMYIIISDSVFLYMITNFTEHQHFGYSHLLNEDTYSIPFGVQDSYLIFNYNGYNNNNNNNCMYITQNIN